MSRLLLHLFNNRLSIHYHTLIILLHRPFISAPDSFNPLDGLSNKALMSYHETCTKSAEQVTRLLRVYAKFYTLVSSIYCRPPNLFLN